MRRGEIFTGVLPGAYGKPRPVVIVQTELLAAVGSVLVCAMTSEAIEAPLFRIPVAATQDTGIDRGSFICAEKIVAVPRDKCRQRIGELDAATLSELDRALIFVLGLAE